MKIYLITLILLTTAITNCNAAHFYKIGSRYYWYETSSQVTQATRCMQPFETVEYYPYKYNGSNRLEVTKWVPYETYMIRFSYCISYNDPIWFFQFGCWPPDHDSLVKDMFSDNYYPKHTGCTSWYSNQTTEYGGSGYRIKDGGVNCECLYGDRWVGGLITITWHNEYLGPIYPDFEILEVEPTSLDFDTIMCNEYEASFDDFSFGKRLKCFFVNMESTSIMKVMDQFQDFPGSSEQSIFQIEAGDYGSHTIDYGEIKNSLYILGYVLLFVSSWVALKIVVRHKEDE